jgi:hypothetical protein
MMEAASTSKIVVNFYQTTRCNNPGDSYHSYHYENLTSHTQEYLRKLADLFAATFFIHSSGNFIAGIKVQYFSPL